MRPHFTDTSHILMPASLTDGVACKSASNRRSQMPVVFASISLSGNKPCLHNASEVPSNPVFELASSTTSTMTGNSQAPSWKIYLGHLAAGATAGCAVEAALYPIDTIKTRLQAMIGGGGMKALWQSGGGRGLYAGIWGNLAGVAPSSAIFMAFYEPIKQYVQKNQPEDKQYLGPLLAGIAAGAAASLTRVPTEVVKQRLQTNEFSGAITAIRTILTKEGFRGLYAGYGAFMLRDLPFDAIEFVAYEQVKQSYKTYVGRDLHTGEVSIIGAIAGGITGIVTTPLDVLKTRLMTQGASGRYKNILDCTVQIIRQEGWSAMMSGWQPRLIWISAGGFVFFPVLEASKKFFAPKDGNDVVPVSTELIIEDLEVEDRKKSKGK